MGNNFNVKLRSSGYQTLRNKNLSIFFMCKLFHICLQFFFPLDQIFNVHQKFHRISQLAYRDSISIIGEQTLLKLSENFSFTV